MIQGILRNNCVHRLLKPQKHIAIQNRFVSTVASSTLKPVFFRKHRTNLTLYSIQICLSRLYSTMTSESSSTLVPSKRQLSGNLDEAVGGGKSKNQKVEPESQPSNEPTTPNPTSDSPSISAPTTPMNEDSIFTIRLDKVPKFTKDKDIKKWLMSFEEVVGTSEWIEECKIKKAPKWDYAFLKFENTELGTEKLEVLKKAMLQFKKNTVSARQWHERPRKNKGKEESEPVQDDRTPLERISDQVTPLWRLSYAEQLTNKQKDVERCLNNFKNKVRKHIKEYYDAEDQLKGGFEQKFKWVFDRSSPLPCTLLPIIQSPIETGYRTKCEFSIGLNHDSERVVGFMLGLFKDGIVTVAEPRGCLNVPENAIEIAEIVQEFIRQSPLSVYSRIDKSGTFRTLLVRTPHNTGQTMTILQMTTSGLSEDQKSNLVSSFKDFMISKAAERNVEITVLGIQWFDGVNNGFQNDAPVQVVVDTQSEKTGTEGKVFEKLLDLDFEISASSFFQVNIPATEKLYTVVKDWALEPVHLPSTNEDESAVKNEELESVSKKTVLLDLCCGTGTIGICMSKHVDKVIGIELVPEAVEDAKRNAAANGVTNAEYIAAPVEEALKKILPKLNKNSKSEGEVSINLDDDDDSSSEEQEEKEETNYVAVLDPPRNGVHPSVIRSIRDCPAIKKVVYVSCDCNQAITNFFDLTRPQSAKLKGNPFVPSRAVAVDLFPHTKHVELAIEFVRA